MLRNFPSDQHPGRGGDTRWGWMETILWEPDKLCLLIQLPLVPVCNTPQRPWEAKWMCRIPSHPSSTVDQTHLHYWFHHEVNKSLVLWDAAFLTIKAQVLRESQAPLTVPSLGKIFRTTGFSGCVSPCVVNFRGICVSLQGLKEKFCRTLTRASFMFMRANLMPMQLRGPVPKGR